MVTSEPLFFEQVPTDSLLPDPNNPRRIDPDELEALTRSIRTHGFVQPVVARRADRMVIGGHQRVKAARRAGLRHVPVLWVDIGEAEARVLGLALNKISGTWDEQLLARLLAELQLAPDVDITLSGFSGSEVKDLLRTLEVAEKREHPERFDLDGAVAEATRHVRTKPGDLWLLGDHRLLCGDATKRTDIERALGEAQAGMAFTDPPYNVDLGNHGGRQRGARRRTIANDALDAAAWDAFVRAWAEPLLALTAGALYVCMSSKEWPTVAAILAELGGRWSDTVVWAKDRFVLGRADYQRAYEPIWYGWREGVTRHWCGDRDQSDVWTIERPADAPLHAVMKPLALMERAIANSSRPGDLVLDPFAGSGSTLIACERTGRRCAAVELDPVYVDVAVRRWERFSGATAVRDEPDRGREAVTVASGAGAEVAG